MIRVIALYRTSTDQQEVDSQKQEVISMATQDGYKESEILCIGCAGASAIKLDKKYIENLNEVYAAIEQGGIECVYAWAIDRIGRNEEILMQFKNRLIKNKVQLKIKTVSTPLFNSEGKVDAGFEMVYAFFATMAKQEMEQKQERFERARKRNLSVGKYNGGIIALGYCIDENGFLAINEKEAELVRLMFRLFNTGKFSSVSLAKELNERGYVSQKGVPFCSAIVCRMLKYKGYSGGYVDNKGREHKLPVIISKEEQEKAISILKGNNTTQTKATKHYYFANKLLVCKECGYHFQVLSSCYQCAGSIMAKREGTKHLSTCTNNTSITHRKLDGMLWQITKEILIDIIENDIDTIQKETSDKISVLKKKISVLEAKLSKYDKKIEEIFETGDRVLLPESILIKRVQNVNAQKEEDEQTLKSMEEELERLQGTLSSSDEFKRFFTGYNSISKIELDGDEKKMYDLVHTYISKVTIEKSSYEGNNSFLKIVVSTIKGEYIIFYHGRKKVGANCFIKDPETDYFSEWHFETIIRTETGVTTLEIERFREFKRMVDELSSKVSMSKLMDELMGSELYKQVSSDNNQRVIQYLNEVSIKILEESDVVITEGSELPPLKVYQVTDDMNIEKKKEYIGRAVQLTKDKISQLIETKIDNIFKKIDRKK